MELPTEEQLKRIEDMLARPMHNWITDYVMVLPLKTTTSKSATAEEDEEDDVVYVEDANEECVGDNDQYTFSFPNSFIELSVEAINAMPAMIAACRLLRELQASKKGG